LNHQVNKDFAFFIADLRERFDFYIPTSGFNKAKDETAVVKMVG
jgi:hypothetical protein